MSRRDLTLTTAHLAKSYGRSWRKPEFPCPVSVPSLFRQTLNDTAKRCKPTSGEISAHTAYPQVRNLLPEIRTVLRHNSDDYRGWQTATKLIVASRFCGRSIRVADSTLVEAPVL
jgi:hypothetical protein